MLNNKQKMMFNEINLSIKVLIVFGMIFDGNDI